MNACWQSASLQQQQQQTGVFTLPQARWIKSSLVHLSLARVAPSDLWLPSRWCRLNDECPYKHTHTHKKRSRHNRTLHRHKISSRFLFSCPNAERSKMSRRPWFNCVHVCPISPRVCDLHHLLYTRKVNSRRPLSPSQGWFCEVLPALMDESIVWRQWMHINGTGASACVCQS